MKYIKYIIGIFIIILLIATNIFGQPKYLEPWEQDYHKQFSDIRIQVISHGLLAPNAHNLQSWSIVLDEQDTTKFSLFVDIERLLPATDPPARQITISQGTFLELINIAAAQLGYEAKITTFPKGEYGVENMISQMKEKPVAHVQLVPLDNSIESLLYHEIFARVTSRTNYYGNALTDKEIKLLIQINDFPEIELLFFQDKESLSEIRQLSIRGVEIEATTDRTIRESYNVFRDSEKEKKIYRDGITFASGGLKGIKLRLVQFLSSTFSIKIQKFGQVWIKNETKNVNSAPTFAMIITNDNNRRTQFNVGRLYARFQLKASQMGISMHPLSQVLQEFPEMSKLYNEVHETYTSNGKTIQMLVRIGRSDSVIHSPRRDVMDLIVNK